MNYVGMFIQEYGMTILCTILTGIAGFIGAQIKKIYEKHIQDDTKKKVVEDCVKAVEQIYHDLSGEEKKQKAIENIVEMLNEKGISIAPIEIEMLIESVVCSFNYAKNDTVVYQIVEDEDE